MNLIKNLMNRNIQNINSYEDFWNWFKTKEKTFFKVVQKDGNVQEEFLDILSDKIAEINDGFAFVTGMCDDSTVELIVSVDGIIKNIVFAEELVGSAPKIEGWKFTSLKQQLAIEDIRIRMDKYDFDSENLFFYSNQLKNHPDEIDLTIVYNNYNKIDADLITNGAFIFLDNWLGELNFATTIDNLIVKGKDSSDKELIPIKKLKEFLNWREKEFIEKYEGFRRDTENDNYSILEAEFESGDRLLAVVNVELLNWDSKASHPWVAKMTIKYDGSQRNGMPNDNDYERLNTIEEKLMERLIDKDGFLYIGRVTAKGEREIYFACIEFRKPSKVFYNIQEQFSSEFEIEYDIYKDKYWQTFNRFNPNI